MKKTGIFYGSTTGNTETAAEKIAKALDIEAKDVHNVGNIDAEATKPYEALILGCSTWGVGELQDDWNNFLFKLKDMDLKGKTVAIFGCGDASSYPDSFCDAIGLIYKELKQTGCTFAGEVETTGYDYEKSWAVIDGKFIGLPIDEDNEAGKTDERIRSWTNSLKKIIEK